MNEFKKVKNLLTTLNFFLYFELLPLGTSAHEDFWRLRCLAPRSWLRWYSQPSSSSPCLWRGDMSQVRHLARMTSCASRLVNPSGRLWRSILTPSSRASSSASCQERSSVPFPSGAITGVIGPQPTTAGRIGRSETRILPYGRSIPSRGASPLPWHMNRAFLPTGAVLSLSKFGFWKHFCIILT